MTNYERHFSDINAIAKLLAPGPYPCRPMCIYHNGFCCDPELRKWGKARTCEEGILAWLNTEEVSGELAKTLEDWCNDYRSAPQGSELKQATYNQITAMAKTYDDWDFISCNVPRSSSLAQAALDNMAALARTVEEWGNVYLVAHKDSELKQIALNNMVSLAQTYGDWCDVYGYVPADSELREIALRKMDELGP